MFFDDIRQNLPNIKPNNSQRLKEDGKSQINPFDLLSLNGLKGEKLILQRNSRYVISGFYNNNIPAIFQILIRSNPNTEENELKILKYLNGHKHIVELYDNFLKNEYSIFVFQKVEAMSAEQTLNKSLTLDNMRTLLKGVLEGLEIAHRMDIVHRNINLQNVVVTKNFEEVYLIGWECATKVNEKMSYSIGSRSIRSPEMLIGHTDYKKKSDIWAFGVLILYILSDGRIPWKSDTRKQTLIEMAAFFGAQNILNLEKTLHKQFGVKSLRKHVNDLIIPLHSSFSPRHGNLDNKDLMDILQKCFILDYRLRPTVHDLLNHAFFKS